MAEVPNEKSTMEIAVMMQEVTVITMQQDRHLRRITGTGDGIVTTVGSAGNGSAVSGDISGLYNVTGVVAASWPRYHLAPGLFVSVPI